MLDHWRPMLDAVSACAEDEVRRLVANGFDLNARNEVLNDPFLFDAVSAVSDQLERPELARSRLRIIELLVSLGADLPSLADDGFNIMLLPVYRRDAPLLESLLRLGANPNLGCGEDFESVYSAAFVDHEMWTFSQTGQWPPDVPDDIAPDDEDGMIAFWDEYARAHGGIPPDMLRILREHGAMSNREMAISLGGDGSEPILWRRGRWQLGGQKMDCLERGSKPILSNE